jgi:hypothetical protein
MQQLEEMKRQTEQTRERLEGISMEAESPGGGVRVSINGNRRVLGITVSPELLSDAESLEDMLVIAVNRAIEKAGNVHETEMGAIARNMMPGGFPGM